ELASSGPDLVLGRRRLRRARLTPSTRASMLATRRVPRPERLAVQLRAPQRRSEIMRTFPCLRLFAACLLGSSLLLSVVHADLKLSAPFDGPARFARVSPADFIHLRAE